jgi:tyrosine-specific transport protein
MLNKNLLAAVATMVGGTVGAGILGVPYVIQKAGFLMGLINIIIIGLAILFMNLAMGEIMLRTPGNHQLSGYCEIYQGKIEKYIISFTLIFGLIGALTAYLLGGGNALANLFGGDPIFYTITFFVIASLIILSGLKAVKKFELILAPILVLLIIVITVISFAKLNLNNIEIGSPKDLLIPYGAIFFTFLAMPAVIDVKEELNNNKKLLKKSLLIGSFIPFVIYLIFPFAVIGATGANTSEIATIGLGHYFGHGMEILGNLFPIFSAGTAFLVLGIALKEIFVYDYKINKYLAWLIACCTPLLLILMGFNSFIAILSIVGGVSAGIDGLLITHMWLKAKKIGKRKPEYSINPNKILIFLVILIFIIALLKTIIDIKSLI